MYSVPHRWLRQRREPDALSSFPSVQSECKTLPGVRVENSDLAASSAHFSQVQMVTWTEDNEGTKPWPASLSDGERGVYCLLEMGWNPNLRSKYTKLLGTQTQIHSFQLVPVSLSHIKHPQYWYRTELCSLNPSLVLIQGRLGYLYQMLLYHRCSCFHWQVHNHLILLEK